MNNIINYETEVSRRLTAFRLRDLQKSGLSFERIYLDDYRNGENGWEIPMLDPFTGKELFCRTRLDNPLDGPKYIQPKGKGLVPFYPHRENWQEIAEDISQDIVWCEGEKKASKLTQEGFLAISMPGVSAYGSKTFIQSIERIIWKGRKTYLCFDSDIRVKAEVRAALIKFAKVLNSKEAKVFEIEIPETSVVSCKGGI